MVIEKVLLWVFEARSARRALSKGGAAPRLLAALDASEATLTNVVSEIRRPRAAQPVLDWWDSVPSNELFLSVLVVGEIRSGIYRLRDRDPAQTAVYERWLWHLRRDFEGRVLAVDMDIAQEWGRMNAAAGMPVLDGLMAATAKVRGLVFVTRNVSHVALTGVQLLDPWETPKA